MSLIFLTLAYAPNQPDGDVDDRLELNIALSPQGQIDEFAYESDPAPWLGRRMLPDGREREVELVRADGAWALRGADGDDAPLWALEGRVFRPGEYVTLSRPDATQLVFRVVNVEAGQQ